MSVAKKINILDSAGSIAQWRDIGAEAQYVDISRDNNGKIITDVTSTAPSTVESVAKSIKNIEETHQNIKDSPSENNIGGVIENATRTINNYEVSPGQFITVTPNIASGNFAHAEGLMTTASGQNSHTEGKKTIANTYASHAEGEGTLASNWGSHAEGIETSATGNGSHAEGITTIASGDYSHAEGNYTTANGNYSHAEGITTSASGDYGSHAEGSFTIASGESSHAEGRDTIASGQNSHAESSSTTASGRWSHAEGVVTLASGNGSHAEGYLTIASNNYSHAEGYETTTSGDCSHTEGYQTITGGSYSHAEGNKTLASGENSHAEGCETTANDNYSHAEGYKTMAHNQSSHAEGWYTTASGYNGSHAEGQNTLASGNTSHAEGIWTIASASYSHAEGSSTKASGDSSHAEGFYTTANGDCSHVAGEYTLANYCQTVVGRYNISKGATYKYTVNSGYFIVGSGSDSAKANCFRATETNTYGMTYSPSGADYAEMFEWLDSNTNNEDRIGKFVTIDGDKIKLATSNDDYILGVISGNPSVMGNTYDDQWQGMFETDIYGRPIYEKQERELEDGIKVYDDIQKVNPNYDNTQEYIPRSERPEWDAVGLVGKLVCIDDGTSKVNGYVKVTDESIATKSDKKTRFRVLKRLDENHIQIMIL